MRKVFISGGTSGIGLACVRLFLNEGYAVATTARDQEKQENLQAMDFENKENLQVEICNLSQSDSVLKLCKFLENYNPDLLINNAAMYAGNDLLQVSNEDLDKMFDTNLKSVILLSSSCAQTWRKTSRNGNIINVGSTLGNKPAPGTSFYSASKAALVSITQSFAMEFAPDIRANIIMPGVVATPIHAKVMGEDAAHSFQKDMASAHPLGRIGTPDEFANMLFSLDQPSFNWMTGSVITVDGGISLIS